jgi:PPK2 family polyphosphate:nucleotide phosphotransferase
MNSRQFRELAKPYVVRDGRRFRLKDFDPKGPGRAASHLGAKKFLKKSVEAMSELQEKLYAQDRWGVLLIFQAMDAAGKDSAIKHVMSGINPQGCEVHSFKAPSAEDLDHDWMWRTNRRLPERGRIGIFNRSYYEELLVARVHPEILARQKIPPRLVSPKIWDERYEDTRGLERYLARNGTVILKFFLHVSKEEQKKRFLARLDEPAKTWKFSASDVAERAHWDDYMRAYEAAIRETALPHAPWFVIPADKKWFTRLIVAGAVLFALEDLDLAYPTLDREQLAGLAAARGRLMAE